MLLPTAFDEAIIGAGPVGLCLADPLGLAGHRVGVLQRNQGLRELPGATARNTTDAMFLDWMRRCRASAVPVRPDRFIAERLAPGRAPARLGLGHAPADSGQPATGEAA